MPKVVATLGAGKENEGIGLRTDQSLINLITAKKHHG